MVSPRDKLHVAVVFVLRHRGLPPGMPDPCFTPLFHTLVSYFCFMPLFHYPLAYPMSLCSIPWFHTLVSTPISPGPILGHHHLPGPVRGPLLGHCLRGGGTKNPLALGRKIWAPPPRRQGAPALAPRGGGAQKSGPYVPQGGHTPAQPRGRLHLNIQT